MSKNKQDEHKALKPVQAPKSIEPSPFALPLVGEVRIPTTGKRNVFIIGLIIALLVIIWIAVAGQKNTQQQATIEQPVTLICGKQPGENFQEMYEKNTSLIEATEGEKKLDALMASACVGAYLGREDAKTHANAALAYINTLEADGIVLGWDVITQAAIVTSLDLISRGNNTQAIQMLPTM